MDFVVFDRQIGAKTDIDKLVPVRTQDFEYSPQDTKKLYIARIPYSQNVVVVRLE